MNKLNYAAVQILIDNPIKFELLEHKNVEGPFLDVNHKEIIPVLNSVLTDKYMELVDPVWADEVAILGISDGVQTVLKLGPGGCELLQVTKPNDLHDRWSDEGGPELVT